MQEENYLKMLSARTGYMACIMQKRSNSLGDVRYKMFHNNIERNLIECVDSFR